MATSPSADTRAFIRWERPVYAQLYAAAKPLMDEGHAFVDALAIAQSYLPPDKQRDAESLKRASQSEQMVEAIELYRRLDAAGRADLVHRLKLAGDVVGPLPGGHRVWWSDREEALLDRRVLHMRITLGDRRKVWYQQDDAQRIELPRDRWRTLISLKSERNHIPSEARLARKGRLHECEEILKNEPPFDPLARALLTEEALAIEEPEQELEAPEFEEEIPLSAVSQAHWSEPAEPPPKSLKELVREAAAKLPIPQPDLEAAPEPLRAIQAPQALPSSEKRSHGPLDAFAGHLAAAMSSLFDAAATHAAASLESNVRRITEQLVEGVALALDRRNQQYTRTLVQSTLEASLGGSVEVPELEQEPLQLDLTGEGVAARLKIDVVGLWPRQAAEARKALNGYADTVRFIEPAKIDSWTPRDLVIASSRHPSRTVEEKCRKAHAHVTRVWGTADSVVDAIKGLYSQAGVDVTQHH